MLQPNNSLLFIIDIQEKLVKAANKGEQIANNMAKVAKAAQLLDITTLVTEQYPKGLGETTAIIKQNLYESAKLFEKSAFSALEEENIAGEIAKHKGKKIILGGIETHICVYQTALDLLNKGYEVYILSDCTSSRNIFEYETGLELLKQFGAKITCTEIVLFEWLKTSKNPKFKEVQQLIK